MMVTKVWRTSMVASLLCVFAAGASAQTVVGSLAQLKPYLDDHNAQVVMTPGTYRITPADCGSGKLFDFEELLVFSGTNSVFDFTGVTIEVETDVFRSFGSVDVREVVVMGNDLVLKNLTLLDVGKTKPQKRAQSLLLDGRRNRVEGFNLAVRGSYPYGYGDIFGKGGGPVISHQKHSAILVRGIDNHLKDTKVFHRSFGHGIFCQGSQNATIEGCYVEGETRTSDDVLAEAGSGSPADNVDFMTTWGYTLQPGWMFSLHEAGIRAYNTGLSIDGVNSTNTTDITILDCTINKMRTGVNIGFCNNLKYVENCVVIDVESGLWLGTEGEAVNFAANAAYGPLLVTANYSNDRDSTADITVLDSSNRYGNDLLAYIAGARDEVTFRGRNANVDTNLAIRVAGIRTGIRQYIIDPKYNDHAATDAVLHNNTQFPVELGVKSSGTSGEAGGSVVDHGVGNSLSPIVVDSREGFSVIQPIQAEDFSDDSGAAILSRGDGIHFVGAAADGDWIRFGRFFMGSGPNRFEAFVADRGAAGAIELRLDDPAGELIGTCSVSTNGGAWVAETIVLDDPRGLHDLYLVFKGAPNALPTIDRFRFYVTFPGWEASKGLVGYWKFDEDSGAVAIDSSGFGHHGTVTDPAWVAGKKRGALHFNGSTTSVSIPAAAFDSIGEEITLAMWVYGAAAQPANDSVFYAVDASDNRQLNVHLPWGDNSTVYWDAGNASGYDRINKVAAEADFKGQWNHWAFTKNSKTGNMRIYLNGEIWHAGAGKTRDISNIVAATIGSQIGGSASYSGILDEVRLYDVELMEHEVRELYEGYAFADGGAPHSWLDAYGLVLDGDYDAAALMDADGDGMRSGDEFHAGTDPTNSMSVLRVTGHAVAGDAMILDWSAVAGKSYNLWTKDSMLEPAWVLHEEGVAGIEPSCVSTVQTAGATGFIQIEINP